jgi:sugar O-acyltransferase (sialic acid O-acetyltransferase NeuD family)
MDVVIFGLAEQSSVTWHLLSHSGRCRVVGFTVDAAYRTTESLHGLPVVDFEAIEGVFPPSACRMIVPLGWKEMNRMRMRKVAAAREKGYELLSFVADGAMVPPDFIARPNTIIQPGAIVAPFARVGENCSIRFGSIVSHHSRVGDHCLVATGATISGNVSVGEHSVLGAGCVVRDGVTIAPGCFIGAGAVVVADTQENGVYLGVPARLQATPADRLKEVN